MTPRGGTCSEETRKRLKAVGAPPYERAVLEVNRWMVRKGLSAQGLADRMGYARITLNHFRALR